MSLIPQIYSFFHRKLSLFSKLEDATDHTGACFLSSLLPQKLVIPAWKCTFECREFSVAPVVMKIDNSLCRLMILSVDNCSQESYLANVLIRCSNPPQDLALRHLIETYRQDNFVVNSCLQRESSFLVHLFVCCIYVMLAPFYMLSRTGQTNLT